MKHSTSRRFAPLVLLATGFAAHGVAHAQSAPGLCAPASEQTKISNRVRTFYAWYVGQMLKDTHAPNKDVVIASYSSRRLQRWLRSPASADFDADYFLQAQDFGENWNQVHVQNVRVQGRTATSSVTLGSLKAGDDDFKHWELRLKLLKENGIWKIDRVDSVKH